MSLFTEKELTITESNPTSLSFKQSTFLKAVTLLMLYGLSKGYRFTFGDANRPDKQGHMPESLHYIRLAIDLNLFIDGTYVSDGNHEAWKDLGKYYESLHPLCRWGGRFRDANHFSFAHNGKT